MGYNTDFYGELAFVTPPTPEQIEALDAFLGDGGADIREHPEWEPEKYKGTEQFARDLAYFNLERTETGLQWDGEEKSYNMVENVNLILGNMRKRWPEFGLTGSMEAHGEEYGDVWLVEIQGDGWAHEVPCRIELIPIRKEATR